ncbi:glycosyltransferase family 87 protein [Sphingomonas sp. C3-2]|uniref:glycosyltransferase family 87 protein n=1 Tax=Sphingomonas sp. C3-2 TaxID=3062169 RepID=UPI00294B48EE|nr:glycosyltransferase family 87 protein [Sphingomonas sp. C3-2]WOK35136.1 glycosyltransferase family 87 protein [Sphingomonas sp. C3-2]
MMDTLMRAGLRGLWRLAGAFGIYGLVVWPVAIWLGYTLIATELSYLHGIRLNASTVIGRDFVNIWHGGREILLHGQEAIYDRPEYRRTLEAAIGARGIYAYSYPPHMLLFSIPFGLLGYIPALILWTLGGIALFWHAARPWLRDVGLPGWSVLFLSGTVVNIWAAHFGFFIGALALYGFRLAGTGPESRPWRAGLAFAVMSVKPHMGVLVPVILAMRRDWRTIVWAGAGVVALVLLSAMAFGPQSWVTWFSSTLTFQASLVEFVPGREFNYMMPSVSRMIQTVTDNSTAVALGQGLAALYALALLVWAWRRGVALRDLGLLSLPATALILPYSFNYDLVAFSLFALIAARRWGTAWWSPERLVFGLAFLVPLAQVPLAREGYWVSPLAIAAMMALAGWRMARDADRAGA